LFATTESIGGLVCFKAPENDSAKKTSLQSPSKSKKIIRIKVRNKPNVVAKPLPNAQSFPKNENPNNPKSVPNEESVENGTNNASFDSIDWHDDDDTYEEPLHASPSITLESTHAHPSITLESTHSLGTVHLGDEEETQEEVVSDGKPNLHGTENNNTCLPSQVWELILYI